MLVELRFNTYPFHLLKKKVLPANHKMNSRLMVHIVQRLAFYFDLMSFLLLRHRKTNPYKKCLGTFYDLDHQVYLLVQMGSRTWSQRHKIFRFPR